MNRSQFEIECLEISKEVCYQKESYARHHMVRLFQLYTCCIRHGVKSSSSLLSIGGGSAYVEAVLSKTIGVKVTILDFDSVIQKNSNHYSHCGMTGVAGNFLEPLPNIIEEDLYDFIIAAEIIEHIPRPPKVVFEKLSTLLKKSGKIIISTPNLASAKTILNLIRHKPIMAEPERFFSEVSAENEGVHRREFLQSEIKSSAEDAGLEVIEFQFINKGHAADFSDRFSKYIGLACARFRPLMLAVFRGSELSQNFPDEKN